MASEFTCPSCNADEPRRLSEVLRQEAKGGGESVLAKQFYPPSQPWGYVQGFLLAIPVNLVLMMTIGAPGESEGDKALADVLFTAAFFGVWVGYGIWKNKGYAQKVEEWKNTIAAKLHCGKCGHVFES